MKKIQILILVLILSQLSCDWFNKKNPSAPDPVSPIPLAIGNKWTYFAGANIVLEIESKVNHNNQPAYLVSYYFANVPTVKIYYLWQWDAPCFYEYQSNKEGYIADPLACFRYPGDPNQFDEWGDFKTILIESNYTVNIYSNCQKYALHKLTNTDIYYSAIKEGIGFTEKSNCGTLISYQLQ
jgi:hypothetical protein